MEENKTNDLQEEVVNPATEVKTFTQEQVDEIVIKRLEKQSKSIYKKLGINGEEEITSLLDKVSNHDNLVKQVESLTLENQNYKKADLERGYKAQLSDVDEEYQDVVFSKLQPLENEKNEEYKERVNAYLKEHPKLAKGSVVGQIGTTPKLDGNQGNSELNQLRKAMGLPLIK